MRRYALYFALLAIFASCFDTWAAGVGGGGGGGMRGRGMRGGNNNNNNRDENREKKDRVVGNFTSVTTDPTLTAEDREKKLEEIAKARGLKLDELKALMDKQRQQTQKLLDEAALVNPKVSQLRKDLDDPDKLKDRAKNRAELARASGVSLSAIEAGASEIRLPWRADLTQQKGFVHGGIIGMIADSAAGYAAYSLMPPSASLVRHWPL